MLEKRLQLIGWLLFILCALLYLGASIQSGSVLSIVGSAVFLVACFFFVIPLVWERSPE